MTDLETINRPLVSKSILSIPMSKSEKALGKSGFCRAVTTLVLAYTDIGNFNDRFRDLQ
jgi:hypothetical protein